MSFYRPLNFKSVWNSSVDGFLLMRVVSRELSSSNNMQNSGRETEFERRSSSSFEVDKD